MQVGMLFYRLVCFPVAFFAMLNNKLNLLFQNKKKMTKKKKKSLRPSCEKSATICKD